MLTPIAGFTRAEYASFPAAAVHTQASHVSDSALLVALKQELILNLNLQVGEVMDGRYEVFATHGKGVFSTVLRARDLNTEGGVGEVAIKIIRANETMYKAAQTEKVGLTSLTVNLQWSAMMFTAISMVFTGMLDGMTTSHATDILDECAMSESLLTNLTHQWLSVQSLGDTLGTARHMAVTACLFRPSAPCHVGCVFAYSPALNLLSLLVVCCAQVICTHVKASSQSSSHCQ